MERSDQDQASNSPYFSSLFSMFVQYPPRGKRIYPALVRLNHKPWRVTNGCTTSPSHQSKSNTSPPHQSKTTHRVPLTVGLTLGLLALGAVVLGGVGYIYRRRGRRPIDPDTHSVSPYTVPPIRRTDQQSIMRQVLKGVPQSRSTIWRPYGHSRPGYVSRCKSVRTSQL